MEYSELPQHGRAIIVNLFAGQSVIRIERVNAAERNFDGPSRCRKSEPCTQMSAADDYFHNDAIISNVFVLYIDYQVRQCLHQLLVQRANTVPSVEVLPPCLVIVAG